MNRNHFEEYFCDPDQIDGIALIGEYAPPYRVEVNLKNRAIICQLYYTEKEALQYYNSMARILHIRNKLEGEYVDIIEGQLKRGKK